MKRKKTITEKPGVPIPGLRVKCSHCNTWVSKCKETGEGLNTCPHNALSYLAVVHIPNTKHGRIVRDLGNNLTTAVAKLAQLREDVKNGKLPEKKQQAELILPPKPIVVEQPAAVVDAPPQATLIEVMAKYIGFLNNVGVPKHKQRERTENHKKDIARVFKYFCGCLKTAGCDVEHFPIGALSDNEVGLFYEYLTEEKDASPFTYNRYLSYFTTFLEWANKNGYPVKNVFVDVERLETETDSRSIRPEHFQRMLPLVTHENGFLHTPGKKHEARNIFRPYLKTGYILGLLTGRRREEICSLKYSSISDDCTVIVVEDFKPNRIKNRQGAKKKFVYIPITRELRRFLIEELEYEKHKGTDRYLLAPEIIENRVQVIGEALSRSFSHYYKQLGVEDVLTFKCLRKTYLSRLAIYLQKNRGGIDVKDVSNHASDAVLDKHYFDKMLIAQSLVDFEVFENRERELQQARDHGIQTPEKTIDR